MGDQELRNTCLAWATTAAHEHQRRVGALSVEYLHWASGNHPGGRGRIPSIAAALSTEGQPADHEWPYDPGINDAGASYQAPTITGTCHHASVRALPLTVDSIETELRAGRCPVIGLRVTDAFLMAAGGVISEDGPGVDGHAVTAVGVARYADTAPLAGVDPGTRLVCVRNSWGPTWGVDGYALMTEDAIGTSGIVAFAVEP